MQDAVIDAAIAAEQTDSGATAFDFSRGSLFSAAVVLGMMDEDDEILDRVLRPSDSQSSASKRIQALPPENVIICRC